MQNPLAIPAFLALLTQKSPTRFHEDPLKRRIPERERGEHHISRVMSVRTRMPIKHCSTNALCPRGENGSASGGPRHRPNSFPLVVNRGPPKRKRRDFTLGRTVRGSGAPRTRHCGYELILSAPQSPDQPIVRKFGLCGRVVPAIAARAVSLCARGHVILGEVMTPNARTEYSAVA